MSAVFKSIQSRPAPVRTEGFVPWIRANLFGDWKSIAVTLIIVAIAAAYVPGIVSWAGQRGLRPNAERLPGRPWHRRLLGRGRREVPAHHLRSLPVRGTVAPEVATILLVALLSLSCIRTFWKPWLVAAVDRWSCRRSSC